MDSYHSIDSLVGSLLRNQLDFTLYVDGINTHFRKIDEEERLKYFAHFIRAVTWYLRHYALKGYAESFLEIPRVFHTLANMPTIRNCMYFKEDLDKIIRHVKQWVQHDQDGELAYVVEEEFLKGMFNAMRKVHEEHLAKRKQRIWAIREELIATVLSPKRAERIAVAHGMEPMEWLIRNEGYEIP